MKRQNDSSHPDRCSNADLLKALSGCCSNQERDCSDRTRRIIRSSIGVIKERRRRRRRHGALALAAVLLLLILLGPIFWWMAVAIFVCGPLCSIPFQLNLFILFLGGAILASAILAGWLRRRP